MKKILTLILVIISLFCLCSCAGNNPDSSANNSAPQNSVVQDDEAHYLIFMIEGREIGRMLVVETDTYENLQPYFPTIPEKEGFIYYWEENKEVYSSSQKEIYINAYEVKKKK